jgi:hypothetical protein
MKKITYYCVIICLIKVCYYIFSCSITHCVDVQSEIFWGPILKEHGTLGKKIDSMCRDELFKEFKVRTNTNCHILFNFDHFNVVLSVAEPEFLRWGGKLITNIIWLFNITFLQSWLNYITWNFKWLFILKVFTLEIIV